MQTGVVRCALLACLVGFSHVAFGGDFYAYYTKVNSGDSFEQYSRTGEYADVVVAFDGMAGRLVFWRGASYLPYWQTPAGKWFCEEIVARSGDGEGMMPDRVNTYSHVQIIESTPERALILWRYLPVFSGTNPHTGVAREKFVEEYFEVTAEGAVRRVVHRSGYSPADWRRPDCGVVEGLRLTSGGIEKTCQERFDTSLAFPAVTGSPVKKSSGQLAPLYCWKFDEGVAAKTQEAQTGAMCSIAGRRPFWRPGVSGTALQIDGYTTMVSLPAKAASSLSDGLTLEGWVAIGAQPWNWVPIIQQGDDKGYFLGVSAQGKPALRLLVNGSLHELVGGAALEHRRWTHVAGTYDAKSGAMRLFVNGALAGERMIAPGPIEIADAPICLGKGSVRFPTDAVFKWVFKADYALDGLLDEVRIYAAPLSAAAIKAAYEDYKPADDAADLQERVFPSFSAGGTFGVQQERLSYYDAWDNLFDFGPFADVVVGFDESPAKFVFWHGMSFVPQVVGEKGQWYNNEWNETWNKSEGHGCMEPLCDKESFFSHVRVLENTPARVVVHWRFACADSQRIIANYEPTTGWADWADWYYYIYPDGVAAKKMQLYSSGELNHEFQESIFVLGPGVEVRDILDENGTVTLSDLKEVQTCDWAKVPAQGIEANGKKILLINFVGAYDPVIIGDFNGGGIHKRSGLDFAHFPTWNHWPICQIASDGRRARSSDRARHSSVFRVLLADYAAQQGDRPYQVKLMLEGITDKDIAELNVLGRSWLQPPNLQAIKDCAGLLYDRPQRAFALTATGPEPEFAINVSAENPLYNPAFVVSNWGSDGVGVVSVDGKALPADTVRQGTVRDTQGKQQLVVWLEGVWTDRQIIKISGAAPK
jgi:hypothetical protein